jgi:DNA invertase Pin-like site-specific DNA recombinase
MNQTFAYTRDDERLELDADAQLSRIDGLVAAHGWELTEHFHDNASEWLEPMFKRSAGARLVEVASQGDAIIAHSAACLSYSATDFGTTVEWFQRKRVSVILVNETLRLAKSATDLAKVVAGELADGEKRRTYLNARIREAQQEEGRYMGGRVPFGWKTGEDGILLRDERQQAAIAQMRTLRENGLSYRAIASKMAEQGIAISHQGVKHALTSDRDLK